MDKIWQFIQEDWPMLLPVVLGFLAVYWLLPRVHRNWMVPGSVAGAAALACGGWYLIHREFATPEAVLFYSFSGLAILGAGLMLAQHNPVRAALAFALVVLSTCGLFLLLAAPFLMAATIIIYAGAIIITFLFVIMLAQQIGMTSADRRSREPFFASLGGFVLLGTLLVVLNRNYDTRKKDEQFGPVIEKLNRAARAENLTEMKIALENSKPKKDNENTLELVDDLKSLLPAQYHDAITNLEDDLQARRQKNVKDFCEKFARVLQEHYEQTRQRVGSLPTGGNRQAPFPSHKKELLPARNVEALGQSLFTDYLVAVEIAGVLLLVATIGAIVISGRRGDVVKAARFDLGAVKAGSFDNEKGEVLR